MTSPSTIQVGKILIAQPYMIDPNFMRAVIVLCDHSSHSGTVGFVMNRCLNMPLQNLVTDFPDLDIPIYFGGPVATDTIHYVHRKGALLPKSVLISSGVFWGGDFELLKQMMADGIIGTDDIRFFVGYSGWSAGQLADEMASNTWIPGSMQPDYLFSHSEDQLWKRTLEDKGSHFSVIGQMSPFLSLN